MTKTFNDGWNEALKQYIEDTGSMFSLGVDMARQTAQSMQSAFQTFFFDMFQGKITSLKSLVSNLGNLARQIVSNVMGRMVTSSIMSFFGFHEGGPVVRQYALGGPVFSNGDSVPALLTPGEFVVSRKGVDILNQINQGQIPFRGGDNITVNVVNSGRDEKPQITSRRQLDELIIDVI